MRRPRLGRALLVVAIGAGALSGCYYDPYTGYSYPYMVPPYPYPPPYGYPPAPPPQYPSAQYPPPSNAPVQQAPLPPQ